MQSPIRVSDIAANSLPADSYVVYGGTFDPMHAGHVTVVRALQNIFAKVIVAPTSQNPWKDSVVASFEQRQAMIALVLDAEGIPHTTEDTTLHPGVSISSIAYVYAEDFVREARARYGDTLYWAVGEDSAESVAKWRNWNSLNVPTVIAPVVVSTHATAIRTGVETLHPALKNYCKSNSLYAA